MLPDHLDQILDISNHIFWGETEEIFETAFQVAISEQKIVPGTHNHHKNIPCPFLNYPTNHISKSAFLKHITAEHTDFPIIFYIELLDNQVDIKKEARMFQDKIKSKRYRINKGKPNIFK